MKKYEKEYLLKKEQEAQLEDPVERLQVIQILQERLRISVFIIHSSRHGVPFFQPEVPMMSMAVTDCQAIVGGCLIVRFAVGQLLVDFWSSVSPTCTDIWQTVK